MNSENYLHGHFDASAPSFNDDGRPEASCAFLDPFADEREPGAGAQATQVSDAESRGSREVINRTVDLLVARYTSTAAAGRTLLLLAYELRRPGAPAKSIRQLADEFGVSSARAFELLTAFRKNISLLQSELQDTP